MRGGRLGELVSAPDAVRRVGVLACVAIVLAAVVQHYPEAMRVAADEARQKAALSVEDREFAGGNSVVADQSGLLEARLKIPEAGTYSVDVGPPAEGWTELTAPYIGWFARYFLLPRRQLDEAPWVLCYACDTAAHPGFETVWIGYDGISILERRP